jgi:hypothetical protein
MARLAAIVVAALVACGGCGFGTYNDGAAPQVTSASDGVADAGQWWPWICPDGSDPAEPSVPLSYSASGTCGDGGAFALGVDGCEMVGTWTALGLTDVTTHVSSSIPSAGGWEVVGTGGFDVGDGGTQWTCEAAELSSGALAFTCTAGIPATSACESTLTPVGGT